jgi:lactate racemase
VCNMAGFDVPPMKFEKISAAIKNPLDTHLRQLARGKHEVAIIFDDMSRITRTAQIVPFILEELAEAGIPDNKIRFISALGCHGAMSRSDFVRKLGEEVVSRFPVYNHNALNNFCTYVGTTHHGIRISANSEVLRCDLKIGIGSISPHMMAGFGGGSKIILPGVTSLGTNEAFHRLSIKLQKENHGKPMGMGIYPGNPLRDEIDEAGKMVGLDFKIDCLFNLWGETTHIFAGEPETVFAEGVKIAKDHYLTERANESDIVIANTFLKANEPHSGVVTAIPSVSSRGGDLVLVWNSPEGIVTHYLMGTFGTEIGAPLSRIFKLPPHVNRMIILSEYPELAFASSFKPADRVKLVNSWDKVLKILRDRTNSERELMVAVYPSSEVQYCAQTSTH